MCLVDEVETAYGTEFRCDIDGRVLWFRYPNGEEEPRCSCTHFYWTILGNGCYPIPQNSELCGDVDLIVRNSVKKIQNGTSYYFLLPNLRHYD